MRYVAIWSLKRGAIYEELPFVQQHRIEAQRQADLAASAMLQYERDPALSMEQWWREEGAARGYFKSGKQKRALAARRTEYNRTRRVA